MPFKSKAQRRKFYAMAREGEISQSQLKKWERETSKKRPLPERKKQAAMDVFHNAGKNKALEKLGGLRDSLARVPRSAIYGAGLGGATGALLGGPDNRLEGAAIGAGLGGLGGYIPAAIYRRSRANRLGNLNAGAAKPAKEVQPLMLPPPAKPSVEKLGGLRPLLAGTAIGGATGALLGGPDNRLEGALIGGGIGGAGGYGLGALSHMAMPPRFAQKATQALSEVQPLVTPPPARPVVAERQRREGLSEIQRSLEDAIDLSRQRLDEPQAINSFRDLLRIKHKGGIPAASAPTNGAPSLDFGDWITRG